MHKEIFLNICIYRVIHVFIIFLADMKGYAFEREIEKICGILDKSTCIVSR
jgi:hypothetical protein